MSEKDGSPVDINADVGVDDDEQFDVLDDVDDDLGDEALDFDEELELDDQVIIQQYVPDEGDVDDAGGLAFGVEDEGDLADEVDAGGLAFGVADDEDVEEEDEDEEDEDVEDDDGEHLLGAATGAVATTGFAGLSEARLARLEEATRVLTEAEYNREQSKVRRKVKAASTGAGALGAIPVLLQLVGAMNLDEPALAATASTVAALLGALGLGWLVPEREQPVAEAPATKTLLNGQAAPVTRPRRRRKGAEGGRRKKRRARS